MQCDGATAGAAVLQRVTADVLSAPNRPWLVLPFWAALIAFENGARLLRRRSNPSHGAGVHDSVTNVLAGLLVGLTDGVSCLKLLGFMPYCWLYAHHRLAPQWDCVMPLWAQLVLSLLAYDLAYYVMHRAMHSRLLWPVHQPHHAGPRMNLTLAVRIGALQPLVSWIFYLPLALAGMPPHLYALQSQLNLMHQFGIHSSLRLPAWLEPVALLLITPAAHRVHHETAADSHGRNFGGVLALWDRACGTYKHEVAFADARYGDDDAPPNLSASPLATTLWPWLGGARQCALKRAQLACSRRAAPRPWLGAYVCVQSAVLIAYAMEFLARASLVSGHPGAPPLALVWDALLFAACAEVLAAALDRHDAALAWLEPARIVALAGYGVARSALAFEWHVAGAAVALLLCLAERSTFAPRLAARSDAA